MNILRRIFRLTDSSDERVKKITTQIHAEFSMLILTIAFVDVIIRGVVLDTPTKEWIPSLVLIIIYSLYYTIRQILLGILNHDIETDGQLRKRYLEILVGVFGGLVYAFISISKNQGLPESTTGWVKFTLLFIVIVFVINISIFYIMRLSHNKNKEYFD